MENKNLELYNKYKQPPKDALKDFNNGRFKGTDINPMWRIKVLTEEFGECGHGWYYEVNRMWSEASEQTGEVMVFCEVSLYTKRNGEWGKPIVGVGGNTFVASRKSGAQASDEAYKMAFTDALGIACKSLGIGADVWWKAAESKYTANTAVENVTVNAPICSDCGNVIAPADGRTVQQIAAGTKKNTGRVLCMTCYKDEMARRKASEGA